jgi:hypothetical protein
VIKTKNRSAWVLAFGVETGKGSAAVAPALSEANCHQAADVAWWAWGYFGVGLLVAGAGLLVAGAGLLVGGLSVCLASRFW